jgi:hypothetical protein
MEPIITAPENSTHNTHFTVHNKRLKQELNLFNQKRPTEQVWSFGDVQDKSSHVLKQFQQHIFESTM